MNDRENAALDAWKQYWNLEVGSDFLVPPGGLEDVFCDYCFVFLALPPSSIGRVQREIESIRKECR